VDISLTGIEHHLVIVQTNKRVSQALDDGVADDVAQQLIDAQQHGVAANPPSTDMYPVLDDGEDGTPSWLFEAGSDPRHVYITTAPQWDALSDENRHVFQRLTQGEGGDGVAMIVILNDVIGLPEFTDTVRPVHRVSL
jgi:hypothetical protein